MGCEKGTYKKGFTKLTAICPKCRKEHKCILPYPWIGNGTPRIYCLNCKYSLQKSASVVEAYNLAV